MVTAATAAFPGVDRARSPPEGACRARAARARRGEENRSFSPPFCLYYDSIYIESMYYSAQWARLPLGLAQSRTAVLARSWGSLLPVYSSAMAFSVPLP
jgi:hypothetical protein